MKAKTKNKIWTMVISIITTTVIIFSIYNFVPISYFEYFTISGDPALGATITNIAATDKLSDSRSVINTNFTNLNNGKIETSTTTLFLLTSAANLTSVGTIATGVWNATAIPVLFGGSGTTTPAFGQVVVGSTTDGFGVVTGFGTSGQFLTSNGANVFPTWQSATVNQNDAFQWTGIHNFTANIYSALFNASSTIVIEDITYNYPFTQGASSTALTNDGAGTLTWNFQDWEVIEATTTQQNMRYATTTTFSADFKNIRITFFGQGFSGAGTQLDMQFNDDANLNNYVSVGNEDGNYFTKTGGNGLQFIPNGTSSPLYLTASITNLPSIRKFISFTTSANSSAIFTPKTTTGTGVWNDASNSITSITFGAGDGNTITSGAYIEITGHR